MSENKFIPNSFQTPNVYVDDLMAFLTAEEWKVLTYAVRRIFGFQKRQDHISIPQFMNGITGEDGNWLDRGTGLGEGAVKAALKSLTKFGVMLVLAQNNPNKNEGKLYGLQLDPEMIDLNALKERYAEWQAKQNQKMIKVRQRKDVKHTQVCTTEVGMTDNPTPGISNNPTVGMTVKLNNNQGNTVEKQGARRSRSDPRTSLPAIQLIRGVTGRLPNRSNYNKIIQILGDTPDGERAASCYEEWTFRGYNGNALGWLDWYVNGIPQRGGKQNGNGHGAPNAQIKQAPAKQDEGKGMYL